MGAMAVQPVKAVRHGDIGTILRRHSNRNRTECVKSVAGRVWMAGRIAAVSGTSVPRDSARRRGIKRTLVGANSEAK
jgi:hypothetical protein